MHQQLQNRRTKLRAQLLAVLPHLSAHLFHNLRQARVDGRVLQARALQYGPQDTHVGISVDGYALNAGFNAQNNANGVAEGKIMDSVSAIEQRAVNIEQEGVGAVPAKSGTHERSSS